MNLSKRNQIIGWLISAFFLVLVFRKIEWLAFLEALSHISVFSLMTMSLIYMGGYALRGLRSRILLPQLTFTQALGGVFVGYGVNNILPARLGEVVRAHVVGKAAQIKRSTALSSVLVERIFDGAAIVALLFVGSTELTLPEWAAQVRSFGLLLFSIGLGSVILVGATFSRWEKLLPSGKIGGLLRGLFEGVALAVRSIWALSSIILVSVLIWGVEAFMFYWGMKAFSFDLSFQAALFVMSVVNLGVLIPSSPGGVGVFQYFAILSLEFLGVLHAPATAYAILIHLCQFLPVTVIALIWLPRFGIKKLSKDNLEALRRG